MSYKSAEWYEQDNIDNMRKYYCTDEYHARNLLMLLGIPDNVKRVVEIGGCEGDLAEQVLSTFTGITRYTFIDESREAIEYADERLQDHKNIWIICEDIEKDNIISLFTPDVVLCTIFEHLNDDLEVIRHIPAGTTIIFTLPNFPWAGHVRHFANTQDIHDRYDGLIDIQNINYVDVLTDLSSFNEWLSNRWITKKCIWILKQFGWYVELIPHRIHYVCTGVKK